MPEAKPISKYAVGRWRHGHARNSLTTRAYRAWHNIRTRCLNPNHPSWHNYGGRGISFCERWESFENFLLDMGEPPPGMSIERVENELGYSPDNCRWATPKEQARNMRTCRTISYRGETLCLSAWAEKTGLSLATISRRFNCGWSVERILSRYGCRARRPKCALSGCDCQQIVHVAGRVCTVSDE